MSGAVLIVEDHDLLAQTVAAALRAEGVTVHLAELTGIDGVLAQALLLRPSVALLDLDLGATTGAGEDLVPGLVQLGTRVVVVTGSADDDRRGTCLERGAVAVLRKTVPFAQLLDTVLAAREGRQTQPDHERQEALAAMRRQREAQRVRERPFDRLTPREAFVLQQLVLGRSAAAIAAEQVVTEATVRSQIRGVLDKLGVSSQLAAVASAHRAGWEGPGARGR